MDYIQCTKCGKTLDHSQHNCFIADHAMLGDGWLDAKEELPEIEQAVLVYFAGAYCVMMRLKYTNPRGKTEIKWSDGNRSYIGVDAWRPLPLPPNFIKE